MSEENEKRLRDAYELWNRHEFEALWEYVDPSCEIDATNRVLNPAHYSGHEGFRRLTEETLDVWETWHIEPRAFHWDGDRVLVDTRITARGRGSGVELADDYWTTWTLRDGKATEMRLYTSKEDALEAFEAGARRKA